MSNIENIGGTSACYSFAYPPEIEAKTGYSSLLLPRKGLFEMIAREHDEDDPMQAAFYREVASYFPDADINGYSVDRDGRRSILVDFDDWDGLDAAQQRLRGNRNAAIAVLDRLRFHLEMMDDDVDLKDEVDTIRRALNELVEPLSMT
jgi:hypothetical protein